ncbi:hypothetical protein ACNFIA_05365 [Pseudomonas sp. NY15437]|uniref:hypothetical protein n=1 Tax=Pseudomonas sp. NY15437 TaxID=3400360 RepID=UPI003A84329D
MERITWRGTPEALLITLYAKAKESELPDSVLRDRFSRRAVVRIDYDFARLRSGHAGQVGIALRAKLFDDRGRDVLRRLGRLLRYRFGPAAWANGRAVLRLLY